MKISEKEAKRVQILTQKIINLLAEEEMTLGGYLCTLASVIHSFERNVKEQVKGFDVKGSLFLTLSTPTKEINEIKEVKTPDNSNNIKFDETNKKYS